MQLKNKTKALFYRSFLISLCAHVAALIFFQSHSLWFYSPQHPPALDKTWASSMEKKEKDQILKEAFEQSTFSQETPTRPSQEPLVAIHPPKFKLPQPPEQKPIFSSSTPTDLLSSQKNVSFSLPAEKNIDLFEHLPKELIIPPPFSPPLPLLPPPLLSPQTKVAVTSFFPLEDLPPVPSESHAHPPLAKALPMAKPFSFSSLPQLPQLPTLEELDTACYSEAFDAEILFLPKKDEGEYFFALTLIPRPDLELPKLKQCVYFLIDRSNSIQRERLNAGKNAIKRALLELEEEDTFNIIAFDSKVEKLSPSPLPISKRAIAKAKNFLDQLQLGSFFSSADLYTPLFLTVPAKVNDGEIHTAILLTDAETLGKKSVPYTLLGDWTAYNQGRVSLFGLNLTSDLHLGTLDAITAFNRGKLFLSPTKRGMKRKLAKLMKMIRSPLAKDLTCKAISRSPSSQIKLFANPSQSPHLYLNEPFVILGTTHSLDDFVLFVQGRLKDRWFHIKKTISFLNAKKGGSSLRAQLALSQAYQLYEQHIFDHNLQHLTDAREILEPYDLQSAFQ